MVTSSESLPTLGPIASTISRELNRDPSKATLGLPHPTIPPTGIIWNSLERQLVKRPRRLHLGLLHGRATLTMLLGEP